MPPGLIKPWTSDEPASHGNSLNLSVGEVGDARLQDILLPNARGALFSLPGEGQRPPHEKLCRCLGHLSTHEVNSAST